MLTWSTTFSTLNQGSPLVVTYVTTPTVGLVPETGLLNVTDTCTTEEISLNQGNAGGRPCPGLAFSLTDANFGAVQIGAALALGANETLSVSGNTANVVLGKNAHVGVDTATFTFTTPSRPCLPQARFQSQEPSPHDGDRSPWRRRCSSPEAQSVTTSRD